MDINAYIKSLRDKSYTALDTAQKTALDALNLSSAKERQNLLSSFNQNKSTAQREYDNLIENYSRAFNKNKTSAQNTAQETLNSLLNSLNQTKGRLDTQKKDTQSDYYNKINEADADIMLKSKRLNELLENRGYSTGDSGQAQLMQNVSSQGIIGGLRQEEQSVYDQIAQALTEATTSYNRDVDTTNTRLANLINQYQTDYNTSSESAGKQLENLIASYTNQYNTGIGSLESNLAKEISNIRNQYALEKAQKNAEIEQQRIQILLEQEAQAQAQRLASASRSSRGGGSSASMSKTDLSNNFETNLRNALDSGNLYTAYNYLRNYKDDIISILGGSKYDRWQKMYNEAANKRYKGIPSNARTTRNQSVRSKYGGGGRLTR